MATDIYNHKCFLIYLTLAQNWLNMLINIPADLRTRTYVKLKNTPQCFLNILRKIPSQGVQWPSSFRKQNQHLSQDLHYDQRSSDVFQGWGWRGPYWKLTHCPPFSTAEIVFSQFILQEKSYLGNQQQQKSEHGNRNPAISELSARTAALQSGYRSLQLAGKWRHVSNRKYQDWRLKSTYPHRSKTRSQLCKASIFSRSSSPVRDTFFSNHQKCHSINKTAISTPNLPWRH